VDLAKKIGELSFDEASNNNASEEFPKQTWFGENL
jgi:hypothetical protein